MAGPGQNHFLASIYGYSLPNNNAILPLGTNNGLLNSFPSSGTRFFPADSGTVINGVTVNAVIQMLPSGLNIKGNKFYTDATVTTLNTNAT